MSCNLVERYPHFRGTCCRHVQVHVEQYALWEDKGTDKGKRIKELGAVSGPVGDSGPEKVKNTHLTGKEIFEEEAHGRILDSTWL
jgi:hypothetical protein